MSELILSGCEWLRLFFEFRSFQRILCPLLFTSPSIFFDCLPLRPGQALESLTLLFTVPAQAVSAVMIAAYKKYACW